MKVRVHELAREVGVPSKSVKAALLLLGYNVKSLSSSVYLLPLEGDALRAYLRRTR